jgi:hypothetical protein
MGIFSPVSFWGVTPDSIAEGTDLDAGSIPEGTQTGSDHEVLASPQNRFDDGCPARGMRPENLADITFR